MASKLRVPVLTSADSVGVAICHFAINPVSFSCLRGRLGHASLSPGQLRKTRKPLALRRLLPHESSARFDGGTPRDGGPSVGASSKAQKHNPTEFFQSHRIVEKFLMEQKGSHGTTPPSSSFD